MIKKLIIALMVLCSVSAYAAAPSVTCTPSRTTGTAPLAVFLDCTSTTGVTMHTGLFTHSWGDSSAGSFTYGSNTALSRNMSTGVVASHVYYTAGSYTITSRVCNSSGECAQVTNAITVTAADTAFATNTMCVANGSLPVAGSGGCPSGATVRNGAGDFDADIAAAFGANGCGTGIVCKRILFKGGDTFTSSGASINSAGPGLLGSYGTGKANVRYATGDAITLGADDWRIMDLDIAATGAASAAISAGAALDKISILRNDFHDIVDYAINADNITNAKTQVMIADNTFNDITLYGIYGGAVQHGIINNYFDTVANGSSHVVRLPSVTKGSMVGNTIQNSTNNSLKLHAPTGSGSSQYNIVSDNKISGMATTQSMVVTPQNSTSNEAILDVVVERNYFIAAASNEFQLASEGDRHTIRNNVFDLSLRDNVGGAQGISFTAANTTAARRTTNAAAYNNTFRTTAAAANTTFIIISSDSVAPNTITNNLGYAPNADSPVMISDTGAVATKQTNTGDIGSLTTSPSFDGSTFTAPADYRIGTGSYAATGGTATFPASNSDFFNCDDSTANEHIGAFVPRGRAQCRGVAGP